MRLALPIGAALPLSVPGAYTWSDTRTALSVTLSVRKSCPGFIDSLYVRQVSPARLVAVKMSGLPTMLWLVPTGCVHVAVNGELASPGTVFVGRKRSVGAFGPVASQFHWLSSVMPKSSAPPRAV